MKKDKIIYWVSTGIIGAMMLFSAYSYFTNPQIGDGFKHLGFPDYFRQELGLAKLIGALVLLIPQIPLKIKEWTYAGFGIVFISASFAHFTSGDATPMVITPIVLLGILVISNIYLSKVDKVAN
ncbi:DoxX family protein [Emticicia sp. SJ17W-69]|uniref:DoxX family protein n=1 Tax=Emticicia sp. SJ17W-69 TaxID=3421657 RepID=UPI003EBFBE3B